jgi:hypothetical protein
MPRTPDDARHTLDALVRGATAGLDPNQLEDFTRYLERRLTAMGDEGDCAYERAMGKVYLQIIGELRKPAPAALSRR